MRSKDLDSIMQSKQEILSFMVGVSAEVEERDLLNSFSVGETVGCISDGIVLLS